MTTAPDCRRPRAASVPRSASPETARSYTRDPLSGSLASPRKPSVPILSHFNAPHCLLIHGAPNGVSAAVFSHPADCVRRIALTPLGRKVHFISAVILRSRNAARRQRPAHAAERMNPAAAPITVRIQHAVAADFHIVRKWPRTFSGRFRSALLRPHTVTGVLSDFTLDVTAPAPLYARETRNLSPTWLYYGNLALSKYYVLQFHGVPTTQFSPTSAAPRMNAP